MPRKGPAPKRPVVADPVYGSPVVSQLVNKILVAGKKGLAERIVYGALEGVASKSGQEPVMVLKKALDNVRDYAAQVRAEVQVSDELRSDSTEGRLERVREQASKKRAQDRLAALKAKRQGGA